MDWIKNDNREYASVYSAFKNLVYQKFETGRYDERYFIDGTNDHTVKAFTYQAVMQFYREAA